MSKIKNENINGRFLQLDEDSREIVRIGNLMCVFTDGELDWVIDWFGTRYDMFNGKPMKGMDYWKVRRRLDRKDAYLKLGIMNNAKPNWMEDEDND